MNAHTELLNHWPSAYLLTQETGVPHSTAKRWRQRGLIADPAWWLPLIQSAKLEPLTTCYKLAKDYQKECKR